MAAVPDPTRTHPFAPTSLSAMRRQVITTAVCGAVLALIAVARTTLTAFEPVGPGYIVLAWAPVLALGVAAVGGTRQYRRARAGVGYPDIPERLADGTLPPGFYPFDGVAHQLRWWNGTEWEDRWQLVPRPGTTRPQGRGRPVPKVVGGGLCAAALSVAVVWFFVSAFGDRGMDLAGLGESFVLVALAGLLAVSVAVLVDGVTGLRRRAARRAVAAQPQPSSGPLAHSA